jgi:hypothetical protein
MTLRTAVSDRSGRPVRPRPRACPPSRTPPRGPRGWPGPACRGRRTPRRESRLKSDRLRGHVASPAGAFPVCPRHRPILGLPAAACRLALSSGPSPTRARYRCPCCSRPFFPRLLLCLPGNRHSVPGRPGGRSPQPDSDPDRNGRTLLSCTLTAFGVITAPGITGGRFPRACHPASSR